MKIKSFLALGAMILALAACKKDNTPAPDGGNSGGGTEDETIGTGPYAGTIGGTIVGDAAEEIVIKIGNDKVYAYELATKDAETPGVVKITIPAGSKGLSFYAQTWTSEAPGIVLQTEAEDMVGYVEMNADGTKLSGAVSSVTVDNNKDKYTVNFEETLGSDVEVLVSAGTDRIIIFGIENILAAVQINITPKQPSVDIDETITLYAEVTKNGQSVQNAQVTWTSKAPEIAAVSQNGVVTGVAEGSVKIVATYEDGKAEIQVDVNPLADASLRFAISNGSAGDMTKFLDDKTQIFMSVASNIKPSSAVTVTLTKENSDNAEYKAFPADAITISKATATISTSTFDTDGAEFNVSLDLTKMTDAAVGTYAVVIKGEATDYKSVTATFTYTKEEAKSAVIEVVRQMNFDQDGEDITGMIKVSPTDGYTGDVTFSIDATATATGSNTLLTASDVAFLNDSWGALTGNKISFTNSSNDKTCVVQLTKADMVSGTTYEAVITVAATDASLIAGYNEDKEPIEFQPIRLTWTAK